MQNGALPPDPQPPTAGGFPPRPLLASGGWGLRPQTPKATPLLRISGYAPVKPQCKCVVALSFRSALTFDEGIVEPDNDYFNEKGLWLFLVPATLNET